MTHTFALMEVSQATYDEVKAKLLEVEYNHAILDNEGSAGVLLDMNGIALCAKPVEGATIYHDKTTGEDLVAHPKSAD